MRAIYLLNFVALALARPQGGYNYRPPTRPSNQYGAPGGLDGFGGTGTGFIGGGNVGFTGTGGTQISGGSIGGSYDGPGTGNIGISTGGGVSTGGGGIASGGIGNIHRHVYVYNAPQEEEIIQQKQIQTGQAQKHYKIIFIKAPSFPAYSQAAIQAQAQNQEKTIIYVLAKRPEEAGDISIPTVAPTQPSKPEVYFIRYKTQRTAATSGTTGTTGIDQSGIGNVGISTGSKTGFTTSGGDYSGSTSSTGGVSTNYGAPGQRGWHILRDWSINSWDYRRVLERLHAEYGATPFFKITVEPNPRNLSKNSIRISPSGLGLPGRSFYYADLDDKIVSAYMRLLRDIVSKMRATSSEAIKFSKDIFYYEKRIAEITPEPKHLEDPINTYNPVSVSELKITAASLPLREILVSMFPNAGISDETEVIVSSHDYLTAISGIVSSTDRSALNNYVIWSLVREYLPYLPTEYTAELQHYNSQLTGIQAPLERWEVCTNMVQRIMGLAVQSMLENHNPISESTTGIVQNVFENIRSAAVKHISDSNYPSEYYKHLSQKTSSLSIQVGLPKNMTTNTYLKNYYAKLYVQKSNLFQNMLHGFIFLRSEMQQQYLEPQLEYRMIPFITSQTYKVGYSGPTNTIIVPRTLLTAPYFEPKYPKSIIYGRLGVDIATAVVTSILPFESSWTKDKGLLSSFHFVVNHSIKATINPRNCLTKYVIKEKYATNEVADLTSLSTLKHLTALRLTDTALTSALENSEHVHQPTLEKYEDSAIFYMTYSQNLCSRYSEQQELLENYVDFKLMDRHLLLVSWRQISNFANALQCTPDTSAQCSDIL